MLFIKLVSGSLSIIFTSVLSINLVNLPSFPKIILRKLKKILKITKIKIKKLNLKIQKNFVPGLVSSNKQLTKNMDVSTEPLEYLLPLIEMVSKTNLAKPISLDVLPI